jgi:hypothetical protein
VVACEVRDRKTNGLAVRRMGVWRCYEEGMYAIYERAVVRCLHLNMRDSKSLEFAVTISGIRALARFPRQPAKAPESQNMSWMVVREKNRAGKRMFRS